MAGENKVFVIAHADDREKLDETIGLTAFIESNEKECFVSYDDITDGLEDPQPSGKEIEDFDTMMQKYGKDGKRVLVVSGNLKHAFDDENDMLKYGVDGLDDFICFIIDPNIKATDLPLNMLIMACVRYDGGADWKEKLLMCLNSTGSSDVILGRVAPGLCCAHIDWLDKVLPALPGALQQWKDSNECDDGKVVSQMINMIPDSCDIKQLEMSVKTSVSIRLMPKNVEIRMDYHETKARNFDMKIYRIENPEDKNEVYYAVLMPNSSLSTLYDMKEDPLCGFRGFMLDRERMTYAAQLQCMVQNMAVLTFDDTVRGYNLTNTVLTKCRVLPTL